MAQDQNPLQDPMKQAAGAMENYFGWLQKAMSSSPWGNTDLSDKMKSYADKNIAATQAYIQQLSKAKDFQDFMRIQTEFMQTQMNSFSEQAKAFGESLTESAASSMKKFSK